MNALFVTHGQVQKAAIITLASKYPRIHNAATMSNSLKTRIEQRLEELGLSARAASLSVGDSPDLIRHILKGHSKNPRADSISKIARALKVSESWLLTGQGDKPAPQTENLPPLTGDVRRADIVPPSKSSMPRDVPVLGTAAGSLAGSFSFEGGVIDYVRRAPGIEGAKDVYAIFVQGDSMDPAYPAGTLCIVHPHRPFHVGDAVIIQTKNAEHDDTQAFIKFYAGKKNGTVLARQINHPATIEFKEQYIVSIHKVLTTAELMGI